MLTAVKSYVYEHKNALKTTTTILYSLHMVRQYIVDRLEDVRDKMEQDRVSQTNLKNRFYQTQEDISFTVLTLITTLADQILVEMDVESLIHELQHRSKSSSYMPQPSPQLSNISSNISDISPDQENRSDLGSLTASSYSAVPSYVGGSTSNMSTSGLQGWVEASNKTAPSVLRIPSQAVVEAPSLASSSSGGLESTTSSATGDLESSSYSANLSRSKAELWSQVKILTVTRTLTVLYSTTLLTLFTSVQLNILSKYKYLHCMQQLTQEEDMREAFESQFTMSNLLFGSIEDLLSNSIGGQDERTSKFDISEDAESRYLTLSWWMLHAGWKDVGERVRRGTEEVFDGVSLKTKVSAIDLHRLISDVRRRVEYEITFEGRERRIDFGSSLLPPTPEMINHVLTQGGFSTPGDTEPPTSPSLYSSISSQDFSNFLERPESYSSQHSLSQDYQFIKLLDETRTTISSPEFAYVLEACLDRATEIMFSGLYTTVFHSSQTNPSEDARVKLAGLLPDLCRWSQLALRGMPNELVDNILSMREAVGNSALIFSKFEEYTWDL